ncbi:MAG: metallophosphoesterase [Zetaproteobacteria bacterium]|nr:MAG: metallophosphoesterase [Zetaproteobacteria bacterium]
MPLDARAQLDRRLMWAAARCWMESENFKHLRGGRRRRYHWDAFARGLRLFGFGLKLCGLYQRGVRNALDVRLNRFSLHFRDLPSAFDGYTLLHLSDLHFDALPGLDRAVAELLRNLDGVDLCVLTGDYRAALHGEYRQVLPALRRVVEAVASRDGFVATLGNHDTVLMVDEIERMGIRVLANETLRLERDGQWLHLTGVDDVHYYYTDMALDALRRADRGFRIALVHSPELYDLAAQAGYALYLAGHTHGGQVALPGGRPIVRHLQRGRHLAAGLWRHQGMVGYTTSGIGVSGLPVRFNTRGEVAMITLRKGEG